MAKAVKLSWNVRSLRAGNTDAMFNHEGLKRRPLTRTSTNQASENRGAKDGLEKKAKQR